MPAPAIVIPGRRQWRALSAAVLAAAFLPSCSENVAPNSTSTGTIAVAPRFTADAAGAAQVSHVRVILTRMSDESVARDTVVPLSPTDTIVDLTITVSVRVPGEQFALLLQLFDTQGDLVYIGGPVPVTASPPGSATPVMVLLMPAAGWPIVFAGDSMGGLSSGIFTVNRDGTGLTNVVPITSVSLNRMVYPRWAPNRSRIVYGLEEPSGPSNQNHLFVVSADGAEQARIVSDTNAAGARWSPDAAHLAFVCYGYAPQTFQQMEDVCVIDDVTGTVASLAGRGDGTGKVFVTDRVPNPAGRALGSGAFAWDPTNPDRIAFVRDSMDATGGWQSSRIYTALFDGTRWNVQALSPDVMAPGGSPLQITSAWLSWTMDGSRIAFSAVDQQYRSHIYAINRDGTGLAQLTATADFDGNPSYAPSGEELLFTRSLAGTGGFDAWIMSADGSGQRQVTAENVGDYDVTLLGYDWSFDGQEIVLTGFETPYGNLFIFRIPRTTTAATYFANRVLIGRGADPGGYVRDIQPSWRP
jgi:Tol biopolymer transport system component